MIYRNLLSLYGSFIRVESMQKASPDKAFYLMSEEKSASKTKKVFTPISVTGVHVSGGPDKFYIHAFILNKISKTWQGLKYEITADEYQKFQKYKGDKRRINLLVNASKHQLVVKKVVASKHIDIRVTPDLYDELSRQAALCKMTISDYCREHLKGVQPRSISQKEEEFIDNLSELRSDFIGFKNALSGFLKRLPAEERVGCLVEGLEARKWRQYLINALVYIDGYLNSNLNRK